MPDQSVTRPDLAPEHDRALRGLLARAEQAPGLLSQDERTALQAALGLLESDESFLPVVNQGSFAVRCGSCSRLLIWPQTCTCGTQSGACDWDAPEPGGVSGGCFS